MRFFHFVSFMAAVSLTLVAAAQEPWEEPGLRDLPVRPSPTGPVQYLDLVPYGTTTLRLTVFPVLGE